MKLQDHYPTGLNICNIWLRYIMLSAGSTFSSLILSIGGLDSNGNIKKFKLYDLNGNIVSKSKLDIITTIIERHKCFEALYYINI